MTKGNLTREQAIERVGAEIIDKLDRRNCEPTSRLQTDGDDLTEWSASIPAKDVDGDCNVTAYYYTTPAQMQAISDADGDGSAIDWTIAGYEIT